MIKRANFLCVFAMLVGMVCFSSLAQSNDKASLIGLSIGYSQRMGTLTFDRKHVQALPKPGLFTGGGVVGRRWRISPDLRLELTADVNYGTAYDDTLPPLTLSDGTEVETVLLSRFLYGGFFADFQRTLSVAGDDRWFFHGGGGIQVIDMLESEITLEKPAILVTGDPYPLAQTVMSGSVHAGLGLDIPISAQYGITGMYSCRFWYPLHYAMERDLFPVRPVRYHERFISHEVDLLLAIARQHDSGYSPQSYWIMPSLGFSRSPYRTWNTGFSVGSSVMIAIIPEFYIGGRLVYNNWTPNAGYFADDYENIPVKDWKSSGSLSILELVPFIEPSLPFTLRYPSRAFLHVGIGYFWMRSNAEVTPPPAPDPNDSDWPEPVDLGGERYPAGVSLGGGVGIGISKKYELTLLPLYHRMFSENPNAPLIHYFTVDAALNIRLF